MFTFHEIIGKIAIQHRTCKADSYQKVNDELQRTFILKTAFMICLRASCIFF
jgi:hypothetical protein